MAMHPAHELFVTRPTFCALTEFLAVLDTFDLAERHFVLGPLYQQFLRTDRFHFPDARSDEDAMQRVYDQFRMMVVALAEPVHFAFVVTGIVTTTLVWLYGSSDPSLVDEFIESNKDGIRLEQERFNRGETTDEERDRALGEIEERLNNLKSDMALRRDKYERFCENVVARLPKRRA